MSFVLSISGDGKGERKKVLLVSVCLYILPSVCLCLILLLVLVLNGKVLIGSLYKCLSFCLSMVLLVCWSVYIRNSLLLSVSDAGPRGK